MRVPLQGMRRLVIVLAALVLTGCTTADAKSAPKPTPTGDPHAYARALIEPTAAVRKTHAEWQADCGRGDQFTCGIGAFTFHLSADTLRLTLQSFTSPTSSARLPALKGDAARLLTETTQDATELATASQKYSDANCNTAGPVSGITADCTSWHIEIERAWPRVDADLAAWEKYR